MNQPISIQSDQQYTITLDSRMIYAAWNVARARGGTGAEIEVRTAFVGDGATVQIRGEGQAYGPFGGMDDTMYGNRYIADLAIPADIEPGDKVWFTAKLPAHGLEEMSEAIPAAPPIQFISINWSAPEARRGDRLTLRAEFLGVRDGTDCLVHILEHDADGNHDPIVVIPSEIRNGRLELVWEYEYHEDTDEIPTEEELQTYGRHYNPPEYFFVVEIDGVRFGDEVESGLLTFRDWVEVKVTSGLSLPLEGAVYIISLADGTTEESTVNSTGVIRKENVGPGQVYIEFPDYTDIHNIDEHFSLDAINKRRLKKGPSDDAVLPLATRFSITGAHVHLAVLYVADLFVIDPHSDGPIAAHTPYEIESLDGVLLHSGSVASDGTIYWVGLPEGRSILKIAGSTVEFESHYGDHGQIEVEIQAE